MGRGRNQSGNGGSSKKLGKSKPGVSAVEKDEQESSDEITLPQQSRITRRRLTLAKGQCEKDKTAKIEAASASTPTVNSNADAAASSRGRQRGRPRKNLNKSTSKLVNLSLSTEGEVLDSENLDAATKDSDNTASTDDAPIINNEEMFIDNINNVENVVEISGFSQITNTLVENSDSEDKQTITMPDKLKNFEAGSFALSGLDDDSQSQSDSVLAQQDENSNNPEQEYIVQQTESPVSQEEITLDNNHDQTSKINPSLYAFASPPHGNKLSDDAVGDLSSESTQKSSPAPAFSVIKSNISHRDTPTPDRIVSSPEILHVRTNLKAPRTYQNKRRGKNISSTKDYRQLDDSRTREDAHPVVILQSQDKSNIIQEKPSGQDTLSIVTECRRSQRNRIIKYDVRDLLNKHRRSKIQIESKIVLKPKSDNPSPNLSLKDKSSEEYDTDGSSFVDSPQIFKGFSDSDNSKNSPITIKEKIISPQKMLSPVCNNVVQTKEISIQTIDLDAINKKEIGIELTLQSNQKLDSLLSEITQKDKMETAKETKTLLGSQTCVEGSPHYPFSSLGESSKKNLNIQKIPGSDKGSVRIPLRRLRPSVTIEAAAPPIIEILNDDDSSEDERELRPVEFGKKPTRTQEIFSKCLQRSQRVESLIESQMKASGSLIKNKFLTRYESPISFNHYEGDVIDLVDDDSSDESTSSPELVENQSRQARTRRGQTFIDPDLTGNKAEVQQEIADTESPDETVIIVEVQDEDDNMQVLHKENETKNVSIAEVDIEMLQEAENCKTDISQELDCSKALNTEFQEVDKMDSSEINEIITGAGRTRSRRSKQGTELQKTAQDVEEKVVRDTVIEDKDVKCKDAKAEDPNKVEKAITHTDEIPVCLTRNKRRSKNEIKECHRQSKDLPQEIEEFKVDVMHQETEEILEKGKIFQSTDDEQTISKPAKERLFRKSKIELEQGVSVSCEDRRQKKADDEDASERDKTLESCDKEKRLGSKLTKDRPSRKSKIESKPDKTESTEVLKEKTVLSKSNEDLSSICTQEVSEMIENQVAEKMSHQKILRETRSSRKSLRLLDDDQTVTTSSGEDTDNGKKLVEAFVGIVKEGDIVDKVKEKPIRTRKSQRKSDIVSESEKSGKGSGTDIVRVSELEESKRDLSETELEKSTNYSSGQVKSANVTESEEPKNDSSLAKLLKVSEPEKSEGDIHIPNLANVTDSEESKNNTIEDKLVKFPESEEPKEDSRGTAESTEPKKDSGRVNLAKVSESEELKKDSSGVKKRRVPTRSSLRNFITMQETKEVKKVEPKKDEETTEELAAGKENDKSLEDYTHTSSAKMESHIDPTHPSSVKDEGYVKASHLSSTKTDYVDPIHLTAEIVQNLKDSKPFDAVEQTSAKQDKKTEKFKELELSSGPLNLAAIEEDALKNKKKITRKRKTNEAEPLEARKQAEEDTPVKKRTRKAPKADPSDTETTLKKEKKFDKVSQDESVKKDSAEDNSEQLDTLLESVAQDLKSEDVMKTKVDQITDKKTIPESVELRGEESKGTDEKASQIYVQLKPVEKNSDISKTEIEVPILKHREQVQQAEKPKNEMTFSSAKNLSENKRSRSHEILQEAEKKNIEPSSSKTEKPSEKKRIGSRRSLRSQTKEVVPPAKEEQKEKQDEKDLKDVSTEAEANINCARTENDKVVDGPDKHNTSQVTEESAKRDTSRRTRRKESVSAFEKFDIESITFIENPKRSDCHIISNLDGMKTSEEGINPTSSKEHCVAEYSIDNIDELTTVDQDEVAEKTKLNEFIESKDSVAKLTIAEKKELRGPTESKKTAAKVTVSEKDELKQFIESKKSGLKQKCKRAKESCENTHAEKKPSRANSCNKTPGNIDSSEHIEKPVIATLKKPLIRKGSLELLDSKKTPPDRLKKLGRKRTSDIRKEKNSCVDDAGDTVEKLKNDTPIDNTDYAEEKRHTESCCNEASSFECETSNIELKAERTTIQSFETTDSLQQKDGTHDQKYPLAHKVEVSTVGHEESIPVESAKSSAYYEQAQPKIEETKKDEIERNINQKKPASETSFTLNIPEVYSTESAEKYLKESSDNLQASNKLDSKLLKASVTNHKTEKIKSKSSEGDTSLELSECLPTTLKPNTANKSADVKFTKQFQSHEKAKQKLEEILSAKSNECEKEKEKKTSKKTSAKTDSFHKKFEKNKGIEDTRKIPTKEEKERILSSVYCPQKTTIVKENVFSLFAEKDKKRKNEVSKIPTIFKGDKREEKKYGEHSTQKERKDCSKDTASKPRNSEKITKAEDDKYHSYRKEKEPNKPNISSQSSQRAAGDKKDKYTYSSSDGRQCNVDSYEKIRKSDKDNFERKLRQASATTMKDKELQKVPVKDKVSLKVPEKSISPELKEISTKLALENLYRIETLKDEMFASAEKAIDDEIKATSELIKSEIAMIQSTSTGQSSEDEFEKDGQVASVQETIKRLNDEIKVESTFEHIKRAIFSNYENNPIVGKEKVVSSTQNVIKSNVELVRPKDKPLRLRKSRWDQVIPAEKDLVLSEMQYPQFCEQIQEREIVIPDIKSVEISPATSIDTKVSENKTCPLVSKAALKAYPAEISFIVSKNVAKQFETIGNRESLRDSTIRNSFCDSTTSISTDSFTILSVEVIKKASTCTVSKDPSKDSTTELSPVVSNTEITPPDSTTHISSSFTSEPEIKTSSKFNEDSQMSFKEDKIKPDEEKPASPGSDKQPSSKEDSQDSQEDQNSNNIRRSHRLKSISKTKQAVGRGLVRDKERLLDCDDKMQMYISSTDLEAENAKFLKDMEERLSQFHVIKENEYRCERVISKEAKKMTCDCFLTREEEDRGEFGCGEDCLNRLLMIECGQKCIVGERCTNRRFQKNLYAPCKVFRTEKKGFGIMADGEILAGEFIMEYIGEVLNDIQFRKRAEIYSKDKNKHYYFMALRSDAIIDATGKGNISRFINHSCDPNAETQKWTVNGELRIGFFSRRRISPGEEITFDYQFQRYGKEAQKCYCESANCRGWIGEEPDSEEEEEESSSESEGEPEEVSPVDKEVDKPLEVPMPVPHPILPLPVPPIGALMSVPPPGLVPLPVPPPIPLSEEENIEKPNEVIQKVELPPTPQVERKKQKHRKEFRLAKKKAEFLEDPDLEEEIDSLTHTGLKNQAHTLRLNRLMVRGKMLATRIRLLEILRTGELPCRRLFLDYHGLRLLHGWMNENEIKDVEKELEVRLLMVQILQVLPIPNKTMLKDSKVYQTIENWANEKEILPASSPNDSPTDSGSATPVTSSTSTESSTTTEAAKEKVEIIHPVKSEIARISRKLLDLWEGLPEVFRIPKRERIEQMKEHEREADRMYKALNLIDEDVDRSNRSNDRFGTNKRVKTGNIHVWVREKIEKKPKDKERDVLSDIDMNLTKLQRRQLFAAKVAKDEEEKRLAEERREFEIRCKFYGLDSTKVQPTDMPFYVNPATGQWFSTDKKAIETPPSHVHIKVPTKPQSTDPKDYRILPMDLPPLWKFAIDPQGRIYYYHVKIRIPQWDPPIKIEPLVGSAEQKDEPVPSTSKAGQEENVIFDIPDEDETTTSESDEDVSESKIRKIVKLLPDDNVGDNGNNDASTSGGKDQELKREQKVERYKLLVQERPISPRREEDRLYNQIEMKRYKENKEKIRKRREAMKRKKSQLIKEDTSATSTSTPILKLDKSLDGVLPLPIQDYLFSSDEEEQLRTESTSPLLETFVQGDKIVDELDALKKEKPLKRLLPIKEKYGQQRKRVKTEERKRTEESKEGKSQRSSRHAKYLARKAKEKFRCDIAGVIVQHLTPYRKDSCQIGRITNNEDFKHLARKLTHFVMIKELKHCDSTGQVLEVTESVKNKSREFIKKYMAKYGEIYIRPENDPEFKDIPHKD